MQDDHYILVRELGAASIVLLKNVNNTLPLNKPRSLVLLGSDAGSGLIGPNQFADQGGNNGILAMGWGSGTANFTYLISVGVAFSVFFPMGLLISGRSLWKPFSGALVRIGRVCRGSLRTLTSWARALLLSTNLPLLYSSTLILVKTTSLLMGTKEIGMFLFRTLTYLLRCNVHCVWIGKT